MPTVSGRIAIRRARWHEAGVGSGTVIDAHLDRAERSVSVAVRELACRLDGSGTNFGRTAENLRAAAQVGVGGETRRAPIEGEGRAARAAVRDGSRPSPWAVADGRADAADPKSPTRIYFGSDGVMAPVVTEGEEVERREEVKATRRRCGKRRRPLPRMKRGADQSHKEFKLVAYYDESKDRRLVSGTKGNHEAAGRPMRQLGGRIDLPQAGEKVGIVDGAPWARRRVESQGLPLDALGLDFYHPAENVHKARRVVYGGTSLDGMVWAGEVLRAFEHDGYDAARDQLVTWRGRWRGVEREAADARMNYVSDRREMVRYPDFARKGWQIGSGPTEACCKTLTRRLKGAGMRWGAENAEAIMALESLRDSNLWKTYWDLLRPVLSA